MGDPGKEAAGGAYLFASSANGFLFRASEGAVEPVAKAKLNALIEVPKKAESEGAQPEKAEETKKAEEGSGAANPKAQQDEAVQPAPPPAKPEGAQKDKGEGAQALTGKTDASGQTPGGG